MAKKEKRIGIMLRHFSEKGGIASYSRNILHNVFAMDRHTIYYLLLRNKSQQGYYNHFPNVREVVLPVPTRFLWDQLGVFILSYALRLDMIFNPKLSIPLLTSKKCTFILRPEQFVLPHLFKFFDRIYFSIMIPLYCWRCDYIVATAETAREDIIKYVGVPPHKVITVKEAYSDKFQPVNDQALLKKIQKKYNLPERFLFFAAAITPLKNFKGILHAYKKLVEKGYPHKLIVAGKNRWRVKEDFENLRRLGLEKNVHFIGWVTDEDMPLVYNLAEMFVFPSLYEGFGIPILEAQACGTPVLTSSKGSCPEVAGGSAVIVDPYSPEEIFQGIVSIIENRDLRERLIRGGLENAKKYSYDKHARELVDLLHSL